MKRLIGVSLIALMACSVPARAQVVVTDPSSLVQQAKELYQQLQSYATQLSQLQQELQTVQWVATTAQSMIQNPNLGAVMALMGQLGLSQDLPISPYAVTGIIGGFGSMSAGGGIGGLSQLTGALSNLNGLVSSSYATNHIYNCTTQSFACQQQQQAAASSAGLQGTMATLYADLAQHTQILQGLRTDAGTATDPAQRENILVEAALENTWAQNTGAQLNSTIGMFQAQRQANEDRDNEYFTAEIHSAIAAAPAATTTTATAGQ